MIKNDRFYVYGEHTILNPYKQKWKGRFYKKLHGDKCGWSFPIEFRAVIDNLLESHSITQSSDIESKSSDTESKSSDTESRSSVSPDILFKEQESTTIIKEWDIDIPIEVYDFFKKYLN